MCSFKCDKISNDKHIYWFGLGVFLSQFRFTSVSPLTFKRSAVFRKAGKLSWGTFTSPAYMNSRIDWRWLNGTSFKIMIGCFDGLFSRSDLKYGLQALKTILWALHVWPSQASVTSVKLRSVLRCLKQVTIFDWKSFHRRQNCCWSAIACVWLLMQAADAKIFLDWLLISLDSYTVD